MRAHRGNDGLGSIRGLMVLKAITLLSTAMVLAAAAASAATFGDNDCGDTCVGHARGYQWAEENFVVDAEDCDRVLEHYPNKLSFYEGCHTYLDDPTRGFDEDDDGNEIELEFVPRRNRSLPRWFIAPSATIMPPSARPNRPEAPAAQPQKSAQDLKPNETKPPSPTTKREAPAPDRPILPLAQRVHGKSYYWPDVIPRYRNPPQYAFCLSKPSSSTCVVTWINDGKNEIPKF